MTSDKVILSPTKHVGILVAIEGMDGSGKSTLCARIYKELMYRKMRVILTREPGDTVLGQKLRAALHHTTERVSSRAEFLMFAADRAEHFHKVIIPELENGSVIISDRLSDSSLAYQGYGRGLDIDFIKMVNQWAMCGIEPNLVIFLDVDEDTALGRIQKTRKKLTSFEQEHVHFWRKVRKGFKEIFKDKDNILILDALKTPEEICKEAVDKIIETYALR
ncbi:dTMP kinase [Candidatus Dependentiae bacterium]